MKAERYKEVTGYNDDADSWLRAIEDAQTFLESDPDLIDRYATTIEGETLERPGSVRPPFKHQWEWIIYYLANPWIFAYNIIGRDVLTNTRTAGGEFKAFSKTQKLVLRDMCDFRQDRLLMSCNRGGAKTFLAAVAASVMAYCIPRVSIVILGGALIQAEKLYSYFQTIIASPSYSHTIDISKKQSTHLKHGGTVFTLTASERSVRGQRADVLFIDECCQCESAIIDAALPQTLTASRLKLCIMSTPDKMYHRFKDMWFDTERYVGWKRWNWGAKDCPWITPKAIQVMRDNFDKNRQKIELEGQFASISGSVYDAEHINAAIWNDGFPREVEVEPGVMEAIQWGAVYQGVDWGYNDPTASVVAAEDQRGHIWFIMADHWRRADEKFLYNILADRSVALDAKPYTDASHPFQNKGLQVELEARQSHLTVQKMPFGKWKDMMVANMRNKLERREVHFVMPQCDTFVDQLLSLSFKEDTEKIEKKYDHEHDAGILAIWQHRFSQVRSGKAVQLLDATGLFDPNASLNLGNLTEAARMGNEDGAPSDWQAY